VSERSSDLRSVMHQRVLRRSRSRCLPVRGSSIDRHLGCNQEFQAHQWPDREGHRRKCGMFMLQAALFLNDVLIRGPF